MSSNEEEFKVYSVNPYMNSDNEPYGITFKGKAKDYKLAHEAIKKFIAKGKEITLLGSTVKIVDVRNNKGFLKVILIVSKDEEVFGNVEMKVYDPSKKKGATIELRKLP